MRTRQTAAIHDAGVAAIELAEAQEHLRKADNRMREAKMALVSAGTPMMGEAITVEARPGRLVTITRYTATELSFIHSKPNA